MEDTVAQVRMEIRRILERFLGADEGDRPEALEKCIKDLAAYVIACVALGLPEDEE